jgi:hypothetical protein
MRGYTSPWEGAAEGLETGVRLGLDINRQRREDERQKKLDVEREQDRAFQQQERQRRLAREDRTDQQAVEDREYVEGTRLLEAATARHEEVKARAKALAQKYGGSANVPEAEGKPLIGELEDARRARYDAEQRKYAKIRAKFEGEGATRNFFSGLEKGAVDISQVPPADVVRHFTTLLKRDPSELLRGPNGEPSKVGAAIEMIQQGLERKDDEAVLEGARVILGPELRQGLGSAGPQPGTEIVDKQLATLVPSPDGRGFIPNMDVTVDTPDGPGNYYAPTTHDRSSNPKSRIKSISLDKALDMVGRLAVLEKLANTPQMRSAIESGKQQLGAEMPSYLEAVARSGVPEGKFTTKDTKLGGTVERTRYNEAGLPVRTETKDVTASPDAKERTRAAGIRAGAANSRTDVKESVEEVEDEDGNVTTRTVYTRIPRAGGAAETVTDKDGNVVQAPKRGAAAKPPTQAEIDKRVNAEVDKAAADRGLTKNKDGKYVDARGRPASETDVAALSQVRSEARKRGEKPDGAANSASGKGMSQAEVDTLRKQAKQAIADGKSKEAVTKRFKEMTGLNL